jgi:hypothetical protein
MFEKILFTVYKDTFLSIFEVNKIGNYKTEV